MTKKQKNWLISLSAIVLAGGVAVGVALPLTMCSPAPTPGPGPTPPGPTPIEKMELKSVGNYGANATTDQDHPIVYINKDQNVDDPNVLRFMEIEVGSSLANEYGCTGWTVSGRKIETNNTLDSSFDIDISANTIPKTVLVDGSEKSMKNIGFFSGNGITSLVIPNFIEDIGNSAFLNCSHLTKLDLSNATSLQTIGNQTFSECSSLTGTLTIPTSVTSIGYSAFNGCTGLTSLDLSGATNLQSIGNSTFERCKGLSDASIEIPNSVTHIGNYAFYDCTGLTGTLAIPSSVTSIGEEAFKWCSGLTGLDFSNATSLQTIAKNAFDNCTGLTNLDLSGATSLETIDTEAFIRCVSLIGTLTIPASVTSIGDNVFNNCKFTSIDVEPGNTKYIKATNLGANCDAILDISSNGIFDNNSKIIGTLACGQLELPNNLASIGIDTFDNCSGLTGTLTIPASVTSIVDRAFSDTNFSEVYFLQVDPSKITKGINIFAKINDRKNDEILIYVPTSGLNSWKTPEIVAALGIASVDQILSK